MVKLDTEGVPHYHHLANEAEIIRNLLLEDWDCAVIHTLREGNQCVDFMAKLGADSDVSFMVL